MSDTTIDTDTMEFQRDLDARGLNCPLPIHAERLPSQAAPSPPPFVLSIF